MKQWFRNVLDVREYAGGVTPMRFSEAQLRFFAPLPHLFRCYNSAGICLDFITDSSFVRMAYHVKLKPGTTERLHFDIFIDDRLTGFQSETFTDEGSGEWTAELPIVAGHPRQVTIYFPIMASVTVKELTFADHAVTEPVEPYNKNWLCFGDSITQGMSAVNPSSTYVALLSRWLEMNVLNQAVSGYVFNADMIDSELPYRPDLITVAYGTNDWSICKSHEQFQEQASSFIRKLTGLYANVPIFVLSPVWRSDLEEAKKAGSFTGIRQTIERICSGYPNVRYIDGLTLTPHHPNYFADGLHPNNEGFLHMAMNLLKQLGG